MVKGIWVVVSGTEGTGVQRVHIVQRKSTKWHCKLSEIQEI